jgi:hypothetical protein
MNYEEGDWDLKSVWNEANAEYISILPPFYCRHILYSYKPMGEEAKCVEMRPMPRPGCWGEKS